MEHYARIVNDAVAEVVPFDPAGRYPDDWEWIACPPETVQGATFDRDTDTFTNPPVVEVPAETGPAYRTTMTPIRFKAQFSLQEQIAIKRARAYVDGADQDAEKDAAKAFKRDALDVLFGSLDDPRLVEVDVADPSVIGGIEFCRSVGILSDERAAEIRRGVPV